MIYPQHFEQKIGFDQVRELIRDACISTMGEGFVDKIRFSSNKSIIEKLLDQVSEFKEILITGSPFPAKDYFDLRGELNRLKTPGTYIEQEALFDFRSSLRTIDEIVLFFKKQEDDNYPSLSGLAAEIEIPKDLLKRADHIINDKGEIRNNASDKLADIRKQLDTKQRQVIRETKKAFEKAKKSGWIPENSEITIRNGRTVIPLHASDKRALGGIIHDESSTGQTVFVEPSISFEVNNEIRELENDERREIIRILTKYTDLLRPFILELNGAFRFLGLIDFIRAKALFSIKIKAERPVVSESKTVHLENAIHPLLFLVHEPANKPIIPLNLDLDETNRILVISGPNAGGKSVCLKTIGLLQYMLQCGLQIPASPDSIVPVFENLFIDIGDEQSLENDLSTYSSHLLNMKFFLGKANANTLFLIDEFGTGTEPQLGGSIAEATLEQLNKKRAFGVVTTHYTNLKLAAEKIHGLVNGAMLFDAKEMQPLYQLQIGNPGSSFAFEIARKIGFPNQVINNAKRKSGGKHVSFDQQLQQLETDKILLEKKELEIQSKDTQLSEMVEKYANLLEDLKQNKKQIIDKARQEAYEIVAGSNKAIERTIKEIKEAKADQDKTREIRKKLVEEKEQIKRKLGGEKKAKAEVKAEPKPTTGNTEIEKEKVEVGDYVRIKNTDIIGELVAVEGKDALMDVNEVKLKTSFNKLVKTDRKPYQKTAFNSRRSQHNIMSEINIKAANFSLSIDLRGKRVGEALAMLQKYVDEAILLSISEVSILHGKGDGILRPVIREYLQTVDEITHYGDAPLDMGGAGITKVSFR